MLYFVDVSLSEPDKRYSTACNNICTVQGWALNDIHEFLIKLLPQIPPIFYDVPKSNRVTHPVSGTCISTVVVLLQLSSSMSYVTL